MSLDLTLLSRLHQAHVSLLELRVAKLLERHGFDAIAVHSGRPAMRTSSDDQFWPLRPTPHFAHWLPLAEADCALLVEPGRKPRLLRPRHTSYWEGRPESETDHFWGPFEVREMGGPDELAQHLSPGRRWAFVSDELGAAGRLGLEGRARENPPALVAALDELRTRKTEYEALCLAEANRRAGLGHEAVRAAFASGDKAELELHLSFLGATAQDDAETPYKNIVALDAHAATLHHVTYGKKPASAQSLLLDAGATFAGYGSDVTRTWVKGTSAGAQSFAQLLALHEAMQQRLCAAVRVGLAYEELHDDSHRQVAQILRELGVAKGLSVDELVDGLVTRAFYPHGLGHSLGLQVHDVGCGLVKPRVENPWLRNTSIIAEGQVFTIEPGIYFIEALLAPLRAGPHGRGIDWALVAELARFGGVRIEDDLLVGSGPGSALGSGSALGPAAATPIGAASPVRFATRNFTREVLPVGGGPAQVQ